MELVAAAAIGAAYFHREKMLATPLFPVDLMRNSIFSLSVLTSICSYTAQSLAYVSLPFFLHYVMHYQAVAIGAMITPWPLATVITAPLAGKLVCRFRAGIICTVGMLLLAVGFALLLLMHEVRQTQKDVAPQIKNQCILIDIDLTRWLQHFRHPFLLVQHCHP